MRKNRILEILAAAALIAVFAVILKADKGYFAECTPQEGYLGSATVYDAGGDAVYKWYSASAYILGADVSNNGKCLAVACEENGHGKVHIFHTDSTAEVGLFESDEIVVDVGYLGNRLCALTEHGVYMLNDKGHTKKHVKFKGVLGDYKFSEGTLTAEVRDFLSGGERKTLSLD